MFEIKSPLKYKKKATVLMEYDNTTLPTWVTWATVHHLWQTYILDRSDIERAIQFYIEENLQWTKSE